jgi:hypothetical protein
VCTTEPICNVYFCSYYATRILALTAQF